MTKKSVRVYMNNPKHRLAITRNQSSAVSELLGFESACDHLSPQVISSNHIVLD